jgi:hypothetical protein
MASNYKNICLEILRDLPEKHKTVILRRFGLQGSDRETLESIGRDFNITRERVRQIESDGLSQLKDKLKSYQQIVQGFSRELKKSGGLRREDALLFHLGGNDFQPQVFFLLTLAEPFYRFSETEEFHPLWTINPASLDLAKETIDSFYAKLKNMNRPMKLHEYKTNSKIDAGALISFLGISKIIHKNQDGFYGLRHWPEINPRGVKDKAFVVFKKHHKPLHFTEVAKLIGPETLPQTVHNELIKDRRFVLVGRGLYALSEWGYEKGQVKDVISRVLKKTAKPMDKQEILREVLKQRMVKENTVLLNLNNKKYFLRTPEGKYTIQKS